MSIVHIPQMTIGTFHCIFFFAERAGIRANIWLSKYKYKICSTYTVFKSEPLQLQSLLQLTVPLVPPFHYITKMVTMMVSVQRCTIQVLTALWQCELTCVMKINLQYVCSDCELVFWSFNQPSLINTIYDVLVNIRCFIFPGNVKAAWG